MMMVVVLVTLVRLILLKKQKNQYSRLALSFIHVQCKAKAIEGRKGPLDFYLFNIGFSVNSNLKSHLSAG